MSLVGDTYALFLREMLIFKKNIWSNMARSIIFPVVFILLLSSFATTPKNVPIAVVNYANGPVSLNFVNALEAGSVLNVISATTQQQAMTMLANGQVTAVLVIPSGFSGLGGVRGVFVYVDSSTSTSAEVATATINSVAAQFGAKASVNDQQAASGSGVPVHTNYVYGATSNSVSFSVAGILVMVAIFGSIFGGGFTLLSDRELGNLKAFMTTPINKNAILFSKILYGTVQSTLSAYIALGIGLLYGATIASGLLGLFGILWFVVLGNLGFSALAIALAARSKQLQTYALIGQTVTMPLSFLGGALVPITSLPAFLVPITVVDPVTYAVNAVRDVMVKGFITPSSFALYSLILIAFTGVMIALSVLMFRGITE